MDHHQPTAMAQPASESRHPATELSTVRPAPDPQSTLRIIADRDQTTDHAGRPIPPITDGGLPYRYKVRLSDRNAYACTADEVLSLFIAGYDPCPNTRDADPRAVELAQLERRGRHCMGVIVQHTADAMLTADLDEQHRNVLQQSARLGGGQGPITSHDCPRWEHAEVELVLIGDLYVPEVGRFDPPTGNVVMLWPGRAEPYLESLARAGLIVLEENPSYLSNPPVEIRSVS